MFNREIFSVRFKMLRMITQKSMSEFAQILNLKSSGTISNLETQKMTPSADLLVSISHTFGVSLDWLAGNTSTAYNNDLLLLLEEEHLKEPLLSSLKIPPEYRIASRRTKKYSPAARSTIITYLNIIKTCYSESLSFIDNELLNPAVGKVFMNKIAYATPPANASFSEHKRFFKKSNKFIRAHTYYTDIVYMLLNAFKKDHIIIYIDLNKSKDALNQEFIQRGWEHLIIP